MIEAYFRCHGFHLYEKCYELLDYGKMEQFSSYIDEDVHRNIPSGIDLKNANVNYYLNASMLKQVIYSVWLYLYIISNLIEVYLNSIGPDTHLCQWLSKTCDTRIVIGRIINAISTSLTMTGILSKKLNLCIS